MFHFFTSSLVRRINAIILSIISIGLVVFAVWVAWSNFQKIVTELSEKANNTLQLAKISLQEPIWNLNQTALEDIRDSIMLDKDMMGVQIKDESGEILTDQIRSKKPDATFASLENQPGNSYTGMDIIKEDDKIGSVHIIISNRKALADVRETSIVIFLFTMALLALLFMVITAIGKKFLQTPIKALESSAISLAEGNFDIHINTGRPDELGTLAKCFAEMRQSIQRKMKDLENLNDTSEELASMKDEIPAYVRVLESIGGKIEASRSSVYLLDDKGMLNFFCYHSNLNEEANTEPPSFKVGQGIIGQVAEQGTHFYVEDTSKNEHYFATSENDTPRALLSTPLYESGKIIGVMNFTSPVGQIKVDISDKGFYETLQRITSVTIKNIRSVKLIEEHNRTLEQKIEARTKDIRDLMDNTGQGFMSFASDYLVNKEYSKACLSFFDEAISGKNVLDLIYEKGTDKSISEIKELFQMVFDGMGDLDLFAEMLPSEVESGSKILSVEYKSIQSNKGQRIMLILTDITTEKALEKQIASDEERNAIIIKVALDKDGFVQFLQELDGLIANIYAEYDLAPDKVDITALFRYYHTVKGGSASYGLKHVAKKAHEIESSLEAFRTGGETLSVESIAELSKNTKELQEKILAVLSDLSEIIPPEDRQTDERFYRIASSKIDRLESFMLDKIGRDLLNRIKAEIDLLCSQPIGPVLKKYASAAQELATRLGKEVEIQVTGGELEISHAKLDSVISNLIHLIRNCVDHGLESPDIRQMLGKEETGHVNIQAVKEDEILKIIISDDGAGIDGENLGLIAIKKGLLTEEQVAEMTLQDKVCIIFMPGFSSKEQVTDVSGRGVGMDALGAALSDLGGRIDVDTELDVGSTFNLVIPHFMASKSEETETVN